MSKELVEADVQDLARLLSHAPRPRAVVFQDCLGGTASAAFQAADIIRSEGLPTVVRGKSLSACGLAFMAGVERSFAPTGKTSVVGFHSPRWKDGRGPGADATRKKLVEYLSRFSGGKISTDVLDLIGKSWNEASGVFFVSIPSVSGIRFRTLYCDGSQGRDSRKCAELPNADPLAQGVITK